MALKGGAKLMTRIAEISRRAGRQAHVRVGFLEGSTYPDGTSTPMVAAIHEFGAPGVNIPARPYFRPMIDAKSPQWGDQMASVLQAADYDVNLALERMGAGIVGQLQDSLRRAGGPPLRPETIARKGFSQKLVETGHLLQSIDFDVKKGRGEE